MKKIISTLACTAILATVASADFARVEMGAGVWSQTPSGGMSYIYGSGATVNYASDKKSDSSAYVWMLVKHPIPVVPNLRVEYTKVKDSGVITGQFKDFQLPAGLTTTTGSLDITELDVIPYYNILDNTFWVTVDLGIDIKLLQTNYKAENVQLLSNLGVNTSYDDTLSLVLPLAYVRGRVEIPGTNIGLEADGKYITYDGSTIYDARAKVDYTLDFIPVVQPAIELGYRVQKFDLKYEDGKDMTKLNIDFAGIYVGLMLRF
jgi:outer membrane protein